MQPLFKWPGGKTGEIETIKKIMPNNYNRYIEPFIGGGALFFHLENNKNIINDINPILINSYKLISSDSENLKSELIKYSKIRKQIAIFSEKNEEQILKYFKNYQINPAYNLLKELKSLFKNYQDLNEGYWINEQNKIYDYIIKSLLNKLKRINNSINKGIMWSDNDIKGQITTGVHAGFYTFIRDGIIVNTNIEIVAKFLYLREFCYGGMFRYNKEGKFNIPYGGLSYNSKSFTKKINYWTSEKVVELLSNTNIYNFSFEDLKINYKDDDFIFLDPPYDSEFSDYDQFIFAKQQQELLADWFVKLPSKALIIIGKTDYIVNLYEKATLLNKDINIDEYEKTYMYNVKGRNERSVTHLAIKNY